MCESRICNLKACFQKREECSPTPDPYITTAEQVPTEEKSSYRAALDSTGLDTCRGMYLPPANEFDDTNNFQDPGISPEHLQASGENSGLCGDPTSHASERGRQRCCGVTGATTSNWIQLLQCKMQGKPPAWNLLTQDLIAVMPCTCAPTLMNHLRLSVGSYQRFSERWVHTIR